MTKYNYLFFVKYLIYFFNVYYINNMMVESIYKRLDQIQHIKKRPSMYIGGIDKITEQMWVLDDKINKIVEKNIEIIPGLYKLFDEILVNSYDQIITDETVSVLKVNIDKTQNRIKILNDGKGIEIKFDEKENMYIPELIFGELMTSSHFDDETKRITGGQFGLGAKLTNIFSSEFEIFIADIYNKKSFYQKFTDNLSKRTKPIIKPYSKKNGFVEITFVPDLEYFKINQLNDDIISLMSRRVYDIAMITNKRVKVYLNEELIEIKDLPGYMNMITDSTKIYDYCNNTESKNYWKLGFAKSDQGSFKSISFVNGMYTWKNGKHVDYILNQVLKGIKKRIEKKYKNINIKDQLIKELLFIVVVASIENPNFSSQSKDELISSPINFGSTCLIDKKTIKKLYDFLDIDTLVENMESSLLSKSTTITNKIKNIPKLYDAWYASTKKSSQCSLLICEGDSAKSMCISGLSALNDPKKNINGRDYYGIYPIRGKFINVQDATKKQISENQEFVNLQKIIGLEIGKEYDENNIKDLRYGKSIIIFTDQDHDGFHIKGLLLNMFNFFWPSLLKIDDYFKIFITPIIKTTNVKETKEFFSLSSFNKWKESTENYSKYTIKYYKGLGTNTAIEAKGYFKNLEKYLINIIWDKQSNDNINLAFNKNMADERKQWLKKYDPDEVLDYTKHDITYSDFINKELKHFSYYDNIRSIPSLIDGLKPSQRKVLYSAFKKNLTTDIKVAQFVGYIAEKTNYHHGELSLSKTIIGMAQTYVGSNNINILVPSGIFGSRIQNGQDAASPRYIFTRLEQITRLIFDPRDDNLLNYIQDENIKIEPNFYVPILPMILVNGSVGIGYGYSTFIPSYNPLDLIKCCLDKLEDIKPSEIHPWFLDFKGLIKKINKNLYECYGKYEFDREHEILKITELPIGTATETYKIFLESEALKDYISKIKNNSDEVNVEFIIKLKNVPDESEINKIFQLKTNINLSNMVLHDKSGTLKRYKNVHDIINEFFDERFEFYDKRKQSILKILEEEIQAFEKKLKFINFVISNKNIFKLNKDSIKQLLIKDKIIDTSEDDNMILEQFYKISFLLFTKEKVTELQNTINEKIIEYDTIKKIKIVDMWKKDLNNLKEYLLTVK